MSLIADGDGQVASAVVGVVVWVFELPAVEGFEEEVGADLVDESGSGAGEGGIGFAGELFIVDDPAVVVEAEKGELVFPVFLEVFGERDGGTAKFSVKHVAVVAVGGTFFVAAHGAHAADTELFAGEECGLGELGRGGRHETEITWEFLVAREVELEVAVVGGGTVADGGEVVVVVVVADAAWAEVGGGSEGGATFAVGERRCVFEGELVDIGEVTGQADDIILEVAVALLEVEAEVETVFEYQIGEEGAFFERDSVAHARLPSVALLAEGSGEIGLCVHETAVGAEGVVPAVDGEGVINRVRQK